MAITKITSVSLPQHLYAHTETTINDNSVRTYSTTTDGNIKVLAVIMSPKGEDGVITTIDKGLDSFTEQFGNGPFSIYGQPLLNARASASTGAVTLQVLRVTAANATYANKHIYVSFRVVPAVEEAEGVTASPAKLEIMFRAVASTTLSNLDTLVTGAPEAPETEEGWTTMRFMSVGYVGRGKCGNQVSFRISNNPRADKTNAYKNYYFSVFENNTSKESAKVSFYPDAIVGSNSIYAMNIINKFAGVGSDYIKIDINEDAIPAIYAAYKSYVDPDTTLTIENFDPILNINKNITSGDATSITGVTIVTDEDKNTIQLNEILGIKLSGGDDGDFDTAIDASTRTAAINTRYAAAFRGEIDPNIKSKYKCPLDVAFDANYDSETVKPALASLCSVRNEDFEVYFDLGTGLTDKDEPYLNASSFDNVINYWTMNIDGYYGKIKDPYNQKIISVTSTYDLAINLPAFWKINGGKHIPYAGSRYGTIGAFIKGTIFPVYDDSIDQTYLDKLVDAHVNFAKIDAKGNVIRGSQTTRYSGGTNAFAEINDVYTVSNLSEANNCHIILDIKKGAEKLVTDYSYNFNEAADLILFNREAETLVSKYAAAQVKQITAKFDRTDEEAELGVLHLYIGVEHKKLVKYIQIDIDVNRSTST